MSKKRRTLLQNIIFISLLFNFSSVLSDADTELYTKYKRMLKKFSTRPKPGLNIDEFSNFLNNLNSFGGLQVIPDISGDSENLQWQNLKPDASKPPELWNFIQNKKPRKTKLAELMSLAQASQNYGSPVVPTSLSHYYGSPSQSFAKQAVPSSFDQSYWVPNKILTSSNQNYATPSDVYGNQAIPSNLNPNNGLLSQIPSKLNENFWSPIQSYGSQSASLNLDYLPQFWEYPSYSNPSLPDYQSLIDSYNNYNPSYLADHFNANPNLDFDQNYFETAPNVMNLNSNYKTPNIVQNGQYHGPPTLIDLSKYVNQNQPNLDLEVNEPSRLNDQEESVYSFLNENPKLWEKLVKNENFIDELMNDTAMKKKVRPNAKRLKGFRNKVTVKRLVPKGQIMTGPVYDEKYQLLYIPLVKLPGEDPEGKAANNGNKYQIDTNSKVHAYLMEESNKLRQAPDVYDPPPVNPASAVDILPPFKADVGPNEAMTYTEYLPYYTFTDYWTYDKPLLQDDCPDYAVKIAGICIKYPPFR